MNYLKFNRRGLFFSVLLIALSAVLANAQTFTGAGFSIIADTQDFPNCTVVTVSGITGTATLTGVRYNNLVHNKLGDLELIAQTSDALIGGDVSSPPDARTCNLNGTYTFTDGPGATQTLDAASTGCTTNQVIPPGNYITSGYGGGTANAPPTTLIATFGTMTPAQANQDWYVCVLNYGTTTGTVGNIDLVFAQTTAAESSVSGKVVAGFNRGISNATVTITDSQGNSHTTKTNAFGNFTFQQLSSGQVYIVTVTSKQYKFTPQAINLNDNLTDLTFVGQ